jgi:Glycosyltransferase like family 2
VSTQPRSARRHTRRSRSSTIGAVAVVASATSVGAVYAGLPLALAVAARLRPAPLRACGAGPRSVSVVIAAHDEAREIAAKLDGVHAQRGDRDLQVIVASDGSTDRTVDIARSHPSHPLVLDLPRGGKASALNAAVRAATGDVVVFTDANSRLGDGALDALLAPFADPHVGGVAGDQRYGDGAGGTARGERDYWSYERRLKRLESAAGNVVSSTGTLHAVRRDLVDVLPDDVTDDFYLSTGVIERGGRLVFAPDAVAWEQPNERVADEYRRRVRIITRGLTGVRRRRQLLDPRRTGPYAVVLAVHKVARRLLFLPMLVALVGGTAARRRGRTWQLLLAAQVMFYATAAVGASAPGSRVGRHRAVALPAHFCAANVAAAHASCNVLRGRTFVTWSPIRSDG